MSHIKIKFTDSLSLALTAVNALLSGNILNTVVSRAQILTKGNHWHFCDDDPEVISKAEKFIRKFSEDSQYLRIETVETKEWSSDFLEMRRFEFYLGNRAAHASAKLSVILGIMSPIEDCNASYPSDSDYPYGNWSVLSLHCHEHSNEVYSNKILLDFTAGRIGKFIER